MQRGESYIRYSAVSGQLFLLIMSTVAIAFIIGESYPALAVSYPSLPEGAQILTEASQSSNDPGAWYNGQYLYKGSEGTWHTDLSSARASYSLGGSAPAQEPVLDKRAPTNPNPADSTSKVFSLGAAAGQGGAQPSNYYRLGESVSSGSRTVAQGTVVQLKNGVLQTAEGTAVNLPEGETIDTLTQTGRLTRVDSTNFYAKNFGKDVDLSQIKNTADWQAHGLGGDILEVTNDNGNLVVKDTAGGIRTYNTATGELVNTQKQKVTDVLGIPFQGGWAHLVEGVMWAGLVVGAIQLIGNLAGLDSKLTNALSISAAAGIMTYKGILALTEQNFGAVLKDTLIAEYAPAIGIATAVVVFVLLYKKEKKKVVDLQCLPWEAPIGGSDCEKCNGDPLKPCSEYRCKSLGQACELVNKGSAEERCVWVARNDVNSPTITPWREALTPRHQYAPLQTRPSALGTKIVSEETVSRCIKPFTPLQFGVITNEPSQCKIDMEGNRTFEEMNYYFGESNLFRYNHTQQLRLPSPDSLKVEGEDIEVPTEGLYNFYVRCQDANGNVNVDEFVINFCVDKSPDATPPIIEETSITSGNPVSFGTQTVPLEIYVNEPAECRWSIQDKAYNAMENNMSCSTHVYEQNARQQYPCQTNLTGVRDNAENTFFFRCKDQPLKNESERNVNQESYRFTLRGSQMLNILSVGPNGTFTGGTDVIAVNLTVRTDDGSDEGVAMCSFSSTGVEGTFIGMFETNSYQHRQTLTLESGNYSYFFRCVDAGGNAAQANTTFSVVTDRVTPRITRLYHESDILRVITNEDAMCKYSLTSCNYVFDEGIDMIILNSQKQFIHAAPWKPQQTYYIKCRDDYGNQPTPNGCSIIASASNVL